MLQIIDHSAAKVLFLGPLRPLRRLARRNHHDGGRQFTFDRLTISRPARQEGSCGSGV
jgi:hypothetical protein